MFDTTPTPHVPTHFDQDLQVAFAMKLWELPTQAAVVLARQPQRLALLRLAARVAATEPRGDSGPTDLSRGKELT